MGTLSAKTTLAIAVFTWALLAGGLAGFVFWAGGLVAPENRLHYMLSAYPADMVFLGAFVAVFADKCQDIGFSDKVARIFSWLFVGLVAFQVLAVAADTTMWFYTEHMDSRFLMGALLQGMLVGSLYCVVSILAGGVLGYGLVRILVRLNSPRDPLFLPYEYKKVAINAVVSVLKTKYKT